MNSSESNPIMQQYNIYLLIDIQCICCMIQILGTLCRLFIQNKIQIQSLFIQDECKISAVHIIVKLFLCMVSIAAVIECYHWAAPFQNKFPKQDLTTRKEAHCVMDKSKCTNVKKYQITKQLELQKMLKSAHTLNQIKLSKFNLMTLYLKKNRIQHSITSFVGRVTWKVAFV